MTTQTFLQVDKPEVMRAFALLAPHGYTELRALQVGKIPSLEIYKANVVSGFFDNAAKFAEAAALLAPRAMGVYIVLNPFDTALMARAYNRVKVAEEATADKDILRRIWLPFDIDPQRVSGVSSTDSEKREAWAVALAAREWMRREFGEDARIVADSGNGYHLLYSIDLAKDDKDFVKNVVTAAAAALDTGRVKIDTSVFNPARIWKLYGTPARKGDDLPSKPGAWEARPHRMSKILEVTEGAK